jgi:hypothetical protein
MRTPEIDNSHYLDAEPLRIVRGENPQDARKRKFMQIHPINLYPVPHFSRSAAVC